MQRPVLTYRQLLFRLRKCLFIVIVKPLYSKDKPEEELQPRSVLIERTGLASKAVCLSPLERQNIHSNRVISALIQFSSMQKSAGCKVNVFSKASRKSSMSYDATAIPILLIFKEKKTLTLSRNPKSVSPLATN